MFSRLGISARINIGFAVLLMVIMGATSYIHIVGTILVKQGAEVNAEFRQKEQALALLRTDVLAIQKNNAGNWGSLQSKHGNAMASLRLVEPFLSNQKAREQLDKLIALLEAKQTANVAGQENRIQDVLFEIQGLSSFVGTEMSTATERVIWLVDILLRWGVLAMGGACCVAGIILAFRINRGTVRPVVTFLTELLGTLFETSRQVSQASTQIAAGSQGLAESTSVQAANLDKITVNMDELADASAQTLMGSNRTGDVLEQVQNELNQGKTAVSNMSENIAAMKHASEQTARIMKTVDEIAFQTNLLALNAAVEAARAGEAGKGFAVVAEEVRNLAQKSAKASQETGELITRVQTQADSGAGASIEVEEMLSRLEEAVMAIGEAAGEGAQSCGRQNNLLEKLREQARVIDSATQEDAATAEETAATAQELSTQAKVLEEKLSELRGLFGNVQHMEDTEDTVASTGRLAIESA